MAAEGTVAILCPWLHHVARGYERSLSELHAVLRSKGVDATLIAGSGPRGDGVRVAPVLRRNGRGAQAVARLRVAAPLRDAYRVEQATFAASALPLLWRLRPRVVVTSDVQVATALRALLRSRRSRPRVLFRNGAPAPPPYPFADVVQHLTPVTYRAALDAAEPPRRHVLLPTGFSFDELLTTPTAPERDAIRVALGLPTDRPVVLAVGALNTSHKRHDHLVREFAGLLRGGATPPYLAIVGDDGPESRSVRALARDLLGDANHVVRSVAPAEVARWYHASDVFTLASVVEALPRVLVEAAAAGLPPVVHDCERTRWVLEDHGHFVDMEAPGALRDALARVLRQPEPASARDRRVASIVERFSWEHLAHRYVALLERVADR